MIGEIYSNAFATYVWLGLDSHDSDRAMDMIKYSKGSWDAHPQHLQRTMGVAKPEDKAEYELLTQINLSRDSTIDELDASARLLSRSWFRRA